MDSYSDSHSSNELVWERLPVVPDHAAYAIKDDPSSSDEEKKIHLKSLWWISFRVSIGARVVIDLPKIQRLLKTRKVSQYIFMVFASFGTGCHRM